MIMDEKLQRLFARYAFGYSQRKPRLTYWLAAGTVYAGVAAAIAYRVLVLGGGL